MTKEDLLELKRKLSKLSDEESKERDLYLRQLALGEIQGPSVGYASIDKPWISSYSEEQIVLDLPKCSVFDYLKKCIDNGNYHNKIALNYYGTKISYDELVNEKIMTIAKSLTALGLKKGDKISLCLPACPEATYLFFAANSMGIICNIIDPRINKNRIEECLGKDTKVLFSIDVFNNKIAPLARKLKINNSFNIKVSESLPSNLKKKYNLRFFYRFFIGFKSWNKFKKLSKNVKEVSFNYNENQPAAIIYTSGTTGVPKAAMLSNENIISVAEGQKCSLPGIQFGDKFLQIMPPFIAYGLVCGMCASLATGLELIVIPKFMPEEFSNLVIKHKPNIIMGVPSFFEEFIKNDKISNLDLSFIKYMIAGGDKMNVESEKIINEFMLSHGCKNKVVKGYGMTEVSSAATINTDNSENILGSVGKPMVKNNVMVVNADTSEELPYGQKGEIYIKSPSIMLGYVNSSLEERKVKVYNSFGECWIKSGDLGYIDNSGNVILSGRIKRMIVRPDGHNVFPTIIEDVLLKHPAVRKCVVIGTDSGETMNGKIPTACIVLDDLYKYNEEIIKKELIKMSSVQLPPRDVALRYYFIDSIDLTPMGKIDYEKLEELANQKFCECKKKVYL